MRTISRRIAEFIYSTNQSPFIRFWLASVLFEQHSSNAVAERFFLLNTTCLEIEEQKTKKTVYSGKKHEVLGKNCHVTTRTHTQPHRF